MYTTEPQVLLCRGDSMTPQRFWEYVRVPLSLVESYRVLGFVKSNRSSL